jgi:hypothetical protein
LKHVGALRNRLAYLSRYNSGWFCHRLDSGSSPNRARGRDGPNGRGPPDSAGERERGKRTGPLDGERGGNAASGAGLRGRKEGRRDWAGLVGPCGGEKEKREGRKIRKWAGPKEKERRKRNTFKCI